MRPLLNGGTLGGRMAPKRAAITADEYVSMAGDDFESAQRSESEGDVPKAKDCLLDAILDLLRGAVRRADGLAMLRNGPAASYIAHAATLRADAFEVYLLDAAHVALILNAPGIARDWLLEVGARDKWSPFWSAYARSLHQVVEGRAFVEPPPPIDLRGQELWLPYFDLMRVVSQRGDRRAVDEELRRCFEARQANSNDPGLLDGRPWDPVLWDWRREAIIAVEN
jgi:hypothetical protein